MDDQGRPMDTFLRGLLSGMLVGAVIAGSTIWERRRRANATRSQQGTVDGATIPESPPEIEPVAGSGRDS